MKGCPASMNSFSQQVWHILAHPSEVSKILCESVGCFRCFDVAHGSLLEIPSLSMESSTWLARFAAELEGDDEKGPIQVLQGEKDGKFGFSMFLMSWNWGNFETVAVKKNERNAGFQFHKLSIVQLVTLSNHLIRPWSSLFPLPVVRGW